MMIIQHTSDYNHFTSTTAWRYSRFITPSNTLSKIVYHNSHQTEDQGRCSSPILTNPSRCLISEHCLHRTKSSSVKPGQLHVDLLGLQYSTFAFADINSRKYWDIITASFSAFYRVNGKERGDPRQATASMLNVINRRTAQPGDRDRGSYGRW